MTVVEQGDVAKFARDHALQFVVLFGSRARGQAGPESDLDLALMPLPGQCDIDPVPVERALLHCLGRSGLDPVWLPHASWLLAWEVARDGRLLYEVTPGAFARFRLRAALRRADGAVWQERDREFVGRVLEGRWSVDIGLVRRKLALLGRYLTELERVMEAPEAEFVQDFRIHRVAERQVELLVECAAAINTEVAQAVANIPPSDYYSSFFSLSSAGWLEPDTALELATIAGLRNRLVHQYEEVLLPRLYEATKGSLPLWRRYLESVSAHLESKGTP